MDALRKNKGYILLESLVALAVLTVIVFSYLEISLQLERHNQAKYDEIEDYRELYLAARQKRLEGENTQTEIQVSFEDFSVRKGACIVEKK